MAFLCVYLYARFSGALVRALQPLHHHCTSKCATLLLWLVHFAQIFQRTERTEEHSEPIHRYCIVFGRFLHGRTPHFQLENYPLHSTALTYMVCLNINVSSLRLDSNQVPILHPQNNTTVNG